MAYTKLPLLVAAGALALAQLASADLLVSPSTLGCALPSAGGVSDCGTSSIALPFGTISSGPTIGPRNLAIKELAGWYGIGVKGGAVDGEIDMNGSQTNPEYIDIHYQGLVTIPEFTLAFLFFPGQYGDRVYEVAVVTADGQLAQGSLMVADATTALWSSAQGAGSSVVNLSRAQDGYAGVWQILNPFGSTQISALRFMPQPSIGPGPVIAPLDNTDSDFAIASITAVPEPGAVLLLGTLMMASGIAARRRFSKSR